VLIVRKRQVLAALVVLMIESIMII